MRGYRQSKLQPCHGLLYFQFLGQFNWKFVLNFMLRSLCRVDTYIFLFHFSYTASEVYEILELNFFFFDVKVGIPATAK